MSRLRFLPVLGLIFGAVTNLAFAAESPTNPPPNIVLIFTDDQGYADVGSYGAEGFETPHLDRLADEGRRFTNFYVAQAVCSASRAALLTGSYPNRIGFAGALGPGSRTGIAVSETTLAELVKQRGYATAIYGKWHLGHRAPFLPTRHGFDEFFGIPYSNDMWPYHPEASPGTYPDLPLFENEEIISPAVQPADQEQLTTQITERAVRFVERHADRPFFLYVAHPMPHVPLYVSEKFKGKSERGIYGDVIMEIDWSVGEIMHALEANDLTDNTLVIFISDNGPWLSYGDHAGSTGPLREGKGTSWEGGVRVPCIMRWPGKIPAGTVSDAAAMTIDLLPTIANRIDAELPAHRIDGKDVWPLLAGAPDAANPHDAYFIYYNRNDLQAVLSGDGRWKLVFPHRYRTLNERAGGTDGIPVKYDHTNSGLELYDLGNDIGETRNLAEARPEIVRRLQQLADGIRADLGDNLTNVEPTGNRPPGRVE